ncbi:MAG: hypothetical protein ABR581_04950 [Thermoleophilaceae bacterium]
MRWMMLLAALASGCGGDDPADKLQGKWIGETTSTCLSALGFVGGEFEQDLICQLPGGSFGLAATTGTFTADGGSLRFTAAKTTCPATAQRGWGVNFKLDGDVLTLITTGGLVTLSRLREMPTGGATATFGCFDQGGAFTAAPLQGL